MIDYAQRIQKLGDEKGDIEGILIEWEEVGIAYNYVQTLLKIQAMANLIQQVAEGRIVCHSSRPREGRKREHGNNRENEIWPTPDQQKSAQS